MRQSKEHGLPTTTMIGDIVTTFADIVWVKEAVKRLESHAVIKATSAKGNEVHLANIVTRKVQFFRRHRTVMRQQNFGHSPHQLSDLKRSPKGALDREAAFNNS